MFLTPFAKRPLWSDLTKVGVMAINQTKPFMLAKLMEQKGVWKQPVESTELLAHTSRWTPQQHISIFSNPPNKQTNQKAFLESVVKRFVLEKYHTVVDVKKGQLSVTSV